MRRRTLYGLIALLAAALIGACLFGLAWLATTPAGTRLLLTAITRYTPLAISAQKIEGRLLDRLSLEKVRLTLTSFEVEIESIDWHWQPIHLFSGTLAVQELILTDVRIRDNAPAGHPPDLTWPRLSGVVASLDARIDHLQVNGLTYQLRDEAPFPVTTFSSAVLWRHALLSFSVLDALTPEGRVTGTVAAGFARPSLQVELAASPAKTIGNMEAFAISGRFHPGMSPEQLTGSFTLSGSSGKKKQMDLAGEAGLTRQALQLRKLRLIQPGRRGTVTGEGSITPTAAAPLIALHLTAARIDLAPELKTPTDLSGNFTLEGTPDAYGGKFQWANKGKGWHTADLSGAFQGDKKGVRISPLHLSILSGSVRGDMTMEWDKVFSMRGEVRGERLDPAGIAPDWTGVVNFSLAGSVAWSDGKPPHGNLTGKLLESRLHGQALTGDIRAAFSGADIEIDALSLRGKGFALGAAGNLRRRLTFTAEISDLERLIPGTAGELQSYGWVRRLNGKIDASMTGRGRHLAAGSWMAAEATLNAAFGEGSKSPLNGVATLRKVSHGRLLVDSATLKVDGTTSGHRITLDIETQKAKAQLALTGAYDSGSWRGSIIRFSGRDATGPWVLASPAALTFSSVSRRIDLAPLSLMGGPQERLEISGTITLDPFNGSALASWSGLNPARARPWFPGGLTLDGTLSGQAAGKILPGERFSLEGRLSIARGKLRWQQEGLTIDAGLKIAEVSLNWQGALRDRAVSDPLPGIASLPIEKLVVSGQIDASGTLTVDGRSMAFEEASLIIAGNDRGLTARIGFTLEGGGTLKGAFASPRPVGLVLPSEGTIELDLAGIDLTLLRPWLPPPTRLEGTLSGRATGNMLPGKPLSVSGRLSMTRGKLRWQQEGLTIDAGLKTAEVSLNWQGILRKPAEPSTLPGAAPFPDEKFVVSGQIDASGSLTLDGHRIVFEDGSLIIAGNDRGLTARIGLALEGGGTLKGAFASPRPAGLALPSEGTIDLDWAGIDLALLHPWLPPTTRLEGTFSGRAAGKLLPGQSFSLQGDASLSGGKIRRIDPEGEINANFRSGSIAWDWRKEALSGTFAFSLIERGEGRGSFQLPFPARLPIVLDHRGPLQVSMTGNAHEKGILSSLFPGLIRESRGELDAELKIGGSWEEPIFDGTAKLTQAGAYLPTAGIQVRDVQLTLRLSKDLLSIDALRASSGPGHIEGAAQVRLKGWRVADYSGSLSGERFQVIYLPELQILATPRLTFEGTLEKLTVRGEVQLPELLIFGPPTRAIVQPSSDVIIEGSPKPVEKTSPIALDVQVRLAIGDRVLVKVGGIDAQLGGGIDLQFQSLDRINSRGEIRVVKGRYKAYGVDLDIVRGRLFYAGGPINQPTLDILALRTIGDVKVGITAGGILRAPVVKLYSEPTMPDVDILAYILFGHPMSNSSDREQAGMMAQAAGILLSKGKSAVLQEQIKSRLGLSTLEIQSGSPNAAGRMGYKEIPAAPAGIAASSQTAGVSQTMLTVGKYLTPKLYFSYGRSLFTGSNLFRLRYDLFKQWQIETQTGTESGVDLYYRIDFN